MDAGQGGCQRNPRWLAYAPSGSQAGLERTTLPTVCPRVMALRRDKWGKLNPVWLGLVQTDLPANTTHPCSMAQQFLILQRCSLATTITDPEVVVAVNKNGWTTASTTDLDINPGIK